MSPAVAAVVDYCRISYDKRGDSEGVETQHLENVESAEELCEEITGTYVDNDLSAFSGVERPEYQRLLADMAADKVRLIIVRHADRLHRDVEEVTQFIKVARAHKVKLYSGMKGSFYNLEKAAGRKELVADTLSASYESDHRGERVSDARKRQARNGVYGGGIRPYGWGVDTGRVRSVCINPRAPISERRYEDRPVLDMTQHNEEEAAEIQRWAKELLAGVPTDQLLRDLAKRGVKTASQNDGRSLKRRGKVMEAQGWSARTIKQILTHPRTSGHAVHQGKIVRRDAYKPIIPEDTRQALITLFADPARKKSPGNTPRWLGSLIALCDRCDDGTVATVRNNSRGEPVYRCRSKGHCLAKAEALDAYLARVLVKRLSREDVQDLLPVNVDVDVAALREEIVTLNQAKKNAARKFALNQWDEETADEVITTATARIAEIRETFRQASADSPLAEFAASDDAQRTWDGLSLGRKREILKLLVTVKLLPTDRRRNVPVKDCVIITPNKPTPPQPGRLAA
ncbi:recombinase family protein [Nonomuraea sp. SMC257]|uniref:Recombinase family protein n=1 Tax=Nonomuraea montanisoli TaxID=2741721 RepID=A0A7Y6M4K2_9ACTN|nr:recombinase family protein [Nonomuraea montanisoli]NUW33646.1 recombinase family protein [Nonomuraea montanisoli]